MANASASSCPYFDDDDDDEDDDGDNENDKKEKDQDDSKSDSSEREELWHQTFVKLWGELEINYLFNS